MVCLARCYVAWTPWWLIMETFQHVCLHTGWEYNPLTLVVHTTEYYKFLSWCSPGSGTSARSFGQQLSLRNLSSLMCPSASCHAALWHWIVPGGVDCLELTTLCPVLMSLEHMFSRSWFFRLFAVTSVTRQITYYMFFAWFPFHSEYIPL